MRATLSLAFLLFLGSSVIASKEIAQVMDSLLQNYDKRLRPDSQGAALSVGLEAYILDVYNFDEINHQVTISMYLRHKWTDKRLAFDPLEVNGTKAFILDTDQVKKVWLPDTFIINERSVRKHGFSKHDETTIVYSTGFIKRSEKITVTIACRLKLRWFPFDQNVCAMMFESYGYNAKDLIYKWENGKNGKINLAVSKEASQNVRHEITAFTGDTKTETVGETFYTGCSLKLNFKRLSFRYILDVYFPTTAIPIVSFITLCVGPLHFRVLLSTICLATMTIYSALLMLLTPKVDYKTALDFYVFNSCVTVFNVVLVNFLIYYLLKPKPTTGQMRMRQMNNSSEDGKGILVDEDGGEDASTAGTSVSAPRFPSKSYELLYKLCEKSYLTMPLFFVLFNIIYWPVVLIASSGTPEDFIRIETF